MYHLIFKDKFSFVFIPINPLRKELVFLPCTTWQPGTELRTPHQHHSEEHNPARTRSSPPGHFRPSFRPATLFNNTAGECWSPAQGPLPRYHRTYCIKGGTRRTKETWWKDDRKIPNGLFKGLLTNWKWGFPGENSASWCHWSNSGSYFKAVVPRLRLGFSHGVSLCLSIWQFRHSKEITARQQQVRFSRCHPRRNSMAILLFLCFLGEYWCFYFRRTVTRLTVAVFVRLNLLVTIPCYSRSIWILHF